MFLAYIEEGAFRALKDKKAVFYSPSESYNRFFKTELFKAGLKTVSDRDISTLDFFLSLYCGQKHKKRIVDGSLYPFRFNMEERSRVQDALKWIQKFPAPFLEEEIFKVLQEYFSQKEGAEAYKESLDYAYCFAGLLKENDLLPRSAVGLYLGELSFNANTYILESHLKDLPFAFSDHFQGKIIKQEWTFDWKDQLDLFEKLRDQEVLLPFYEFRGQEDEVRYILKELQESFSNGEKVAVLYPRESGYESLLNLYQREFFKEQVFFFKEKEEGSFLDFIEKLRREVSGLTTYYDQASDNKNFSKIRDMKLDKFNLEELLSNYYRYDFTNVDINLISQISIQIDPEAKYDLKDWLYIFSSLQSKESYLQGRLKSEFEVGDYSYIPSTDVERVFVLGWGDKIFKNVGEDLFSPSLLWSLERDLGFYFPSLRKSKARELFNNPCMSLLKGKRCFFTYSEKKSHGGQNEAGVLKILTPSLEKKGEVNRDFLGHQKISLKRKTLDYKEGSLSSSSLQRYDECPYKFYLEKVLGFRESEEVDYFLSYLEDGKLSHYLLEKILGKDITKEDFIRLSREYVKSQLDEDFDSFRFLEADRMAERIWGVLQEERAYLEEKNIRVVAVEKFFKIYIDVRERTFKKTKGDYSLVGFIDRVDETPDKEVLLYDYKRADSGTSLLNRYNGKKLLPQMFLYSLAVDYGLLGDFKNLLSFQFINLKESKRSKGFVLKGKGEKFVKELSRGSAITEEVLEEKMKLFLNKFWEVVGRIADGDFVAEPNPQYSNTCSTCSWVGICKKSQTFI